jgi:hypothetical protein
MNGKIVLPRNAAVFRADDGQEIVYLTGSPFADGQVLYSPDGAEHYALAYRNFVGTTRRHSFSFEDPHHSRRSSLGRFGELVYLKDVIFSKVTKGTAPREITVVPLPTSENKQEHLFRLPDRRCVYIIIDACENSGAPYQAFLGRGETLRAVPVDEYRDEPGFGWLVVIDDHDLWVEEDGSLTWDNEDIERLDFSQLLVIHGPMSVTITSR